MRPVDGTGLCHGRSLHRCANERVCVLFIGTPSVNLALSECIHYDNSLVIICVCVHVCVRAGVHARACMRACMRACVCVSAGERRRRRRKSRGRGRGGAGGRESGTSRTRYGDLIRKSVRLKKLEYCIKVQVLCPSEQTCRTSRSSTGRMRRWHAPHACRTS